MTLARLSLAVVLGGVLGVSSGCATVGSFSAGTGLDRAFVGEETRPAMGRAVELWSAGHGRRAVLEYVRCAESGDDESILSAFERLSESEFGELPGEERLELQRALLRSVDEFRSLSRAVLREGHEAGEVDHERRVDAVARVGTVLAGSDRVLIVQHLGLALVRGAESARESGPPARSARR